MIINVTEELADRALNLLIENGGDLAGTLDLAQWMYGDTRDESRGVTLLGIITRIKEKIAQKATPWTGPVYRVAVAVSEDWVIYVGSSNPADAQIVAEQEYDKGIAKGGDALSAFCELVTDGHKPNVTEDTADPSTIDYLNEINSFSEEGGL